MDQVSALDAPVPTRVVDAPLAVKLEGVSRRYEVGGGVVYALRDVNLEIAQGEFVVVLGPSGSGKTTLLNMIGALDTASEGRVTIAGRSITGASRSDLFALRRNTVAFIFQTFNLFPTLTCLLYTSPSPRDRTRSRMPSSA